MITSIKLCDTNSAIRCAVCGKAVALTPIEARSLLPLGGRQFTTFRLCDECIRAIKFAKVLMKNNPNMNIDGDDGK